MEVAERFNIIIKMLGLSRNEFAKAIGMRSTQIYSVTNGRNKPSHAMYGRIIKYFPMINIYYLLNGEGEPFRKFYTIQFEDTWQPTQSLSEKS